MLRTILIGAYALGAVGTAGAAEVFTSGPQQVTLLELFTSEGCSSCPPAEEWFGVLREDPGLWTEFVPVAFHVNYWDRLGWPDRFAKREFTARQYAYAQSWGAPSVYTPGFVRDGREWRRGQAAPRTGLSGLLVVERLGESSWRIHFAPADAKGERGEYEIQFAVLGGGIASPVRRGENAGKTLHHEFVALELRRANLTPDGRRSFSAEVELAVPEVYGASQFAVAAWVRVRGGLEPLQAVGGWLK